MGPCDICGQQPQAIQLGNMETGEQQFICVGCAARWGLDFAKAVLPAEEIANTLGPMFVWRREEAPPDVTFEAPKARKSKAKAKAAAAQGEAGGAAPVAPAAENG